MLLVVWLIKTSKQFSLTMITAPLSYLGLHDVYCVSYGSKLLQVLFLHLQRHWCTSCHIL